MMREQALVIAQPLIEQLEPYCERIAIAGSIRRRLSPTVGDIEIVVKPFITDRFDLFGEPSGFVSRLDQLDFTQWGRIIRGGARHKKIALPQGIDLDLFIVLPPAQWGAILALRTGPAAYSRWLVSPRRQGGALPGHLRQRDGALWHGETLLETPDEEDYFSALELPYPEPHERQARWGTSGARQSNAGAAVTRL